MITIHSNFRVIALLPKVLLLEWEEQPSEKLLEFLLSYKAVIEKQIKVTRCVMGYQSLMVHLLEDIEKLDWWKQHLNKLLIKTKKQNYNSFILLLFLGINLLKSDSILYLPYLTLLIFAFLLFDKLTKYK